MSSRPHTQRAVAWLCLALAVLFALLPTAGVMVCFGHDGHVGFSTSAEVGACPCEHAPEAGHEKPSDSRENADSANEPNRHPLCEDVAVDPPEVLKDSRLAGASAQTTGDLPDDDDQTNDLSAWAPDGYLDTASCARRTDAAGASDVLLPPRQHLEHKRVVVLLI